MSRETYKDLGVSALACLLIAYLSGCAVLRVTDKAVVLSYGTGDRELWSNIDRIPMIGPALQTVYLPPILLECKLRHLEWSP
jgi:hypothetical protein